MSTELEIVRAARQMIANHGQHAALKAEWRARNLWPEARDAAAIWMKIARTIRSMQQANEH